MRTLHLINGLGTGGAERSIAELIPAMTSHGIEPTFAVFHRRAQGVEAAVEASGVPIIHIRSTTWLGRIRELRRVLRQGSFDLLHTSLFESDVVGRLASLGLAIPVLTSLVNTTYDPARRDDPNVRAWRLRAVQAVDAATAHLNTDHFHAITVAVAESAQKHLRISGNDITVISRSRDLGRLGTATRTRRSAVRRRLGIAPGAPVILQVGRLEFQKGHRYLLDAAGSVATSHPDLVILLAGRDGNASAEIHERIDELHLAGVDVRHLGHVEDVPDLVVAADVFVFPSLYEGQGGALIEAMALGARIVASDIPAIRETTRGRADLVPPGDPGRLADQLLRALVRGDGAAEASDDMRDSLEDFDHHRVSEHMCALFLTVAHQR